MKGTVMEDTNIKDMEEWMTSQEWEDYKKIMTAMKNCSTKPENLE